MNNAEMLVSGLEIQPLDEKKFKRAEGLSTFCALTGRYITTGYPVSKIVPKNTSEFLHLLNGRPTGYLSDEAARAFKGSWNLGSRLIFEDGTMYHPLISRKAAKKQGRSCWSSLVRDVWPECAGQECLIIVATDFKKKVWYWSRVGQLGKTSEVLLFDGKHDALHRLIVDWECLISTLDFVEQLYDAGFSKQTIAESLWLDYKKLRELGAAKIQEAEGQLIEMRDTQEFELCIVIAQKSL